MGSGSPEKGQKALAEMENAREPSSRGQECDSITQTKRELADVAALPKQGGLTDLGRQSYLLRTRGKFPLFYLWQ